MRRLLATGSGNRCQVCTWLWGRTGKSGLDSRSLGRQSQENGFCGVGERKTGLMGSRRASGPERMAWPFTGMERTMGGTSVRNRLAADSGDTIRKCKRQLRGSCQQGPMPVLEGQVSQGHECPTEGTVGFLRAGSASHPRHQGIKPSARHTAGTQKIHVCTSLCSYGYTYAELLQCHALF